MNLDSMFSGTTIPALQETVRFAEARHRLLAGNIANLDTPGYQVRDLSPERFQELLGKAIESSKRGESSAGVSYDGSDEQDPIRRVRDQMKAILRHDGSDVGLEPQILQVAKNQSLHSLSIALLRKQFALLQTAISERVDI
jgi:flagellar basal-body rod protein FlgB